MVLCGLLKIVTGPKIDKIFCQHVCGNRQIQVYIEPSCFKTKTNFNYYPLEKQEGITT